ncbi:ABC transporter periplasmic solute-binding protein [Kribbella flavida DSM 17836]|uniref:ABC transporter periplasmic solute-binding protein n=1 Tax=Kribbella flavida (strain DSM 17836 / JCM 10339 / NBRC 14399) TaxID=479435 RepID=D2PPX9_KRIFD|nr:ABC transporter substrate-binding protein [Kribbella flavida]ADB32903.1 ABC transporter periplasmic solute-binding protein [Kribbella flavida DSM 17836]
MNSRTRTSRPHRTLLTAGVGLATLAVVGCAPSTTETGTGTAGAGQAAFAGPVIDQSFDLTALVAAAKQEGSVTVYDSTGDIVKVAEAFQAKYGIKTTGVKSDVGDTLEKMTREAQAKNVTIDLTLYENGPTLVGQLLPQKTVYTWIPADLAPQIDEANRNPLMVLSKANVWIYNPKLFPQGCPVDNLWDLTSPEWKGKVMLQDPLGKPNIVEWFNQMGSSYDADLRAAYQANSGQELSTTEPTAAREWVKQLAKNDPVLTSADDDVSAAVASPNQTEPRIGLVSIAKFRDVKGKGYQMKVCDTLKPYVGYQYPKFGAIATGSKHPNAAKLFMHFVLTAEGITPEMGSGGISGNKAVPPSSNNPPGLTDWSTQLMKFDSAKLLKDFQDAQAMQDHWRLNHR